MVDTSEMQWIRWADGDPLTEAYILVTDDGTPVGFIGERDTYWHGYWQDGSYAGTWPSLGEAMEGLEALESPSLCDNDGCLNSALADHSECGECLAAPYTLRFDRPWM